MDYGWIQLRLECVGVGKYTGGSHEVTVAYHSVFNGENDRKYIRV